VALAHDHHPSLPSFREGQLFIDGCAECERRCAEPWVAINNMDPMRFVTAWFRALAWQKDEDDPPVSKCEVRVLTIFATFQVKLEQVGLALGIPFLIFSSPRATSPED
jgi:hypothetical protein